MQIQIKKLKSNAVIPTCGSQYSAGYDLYAALGTESVVIPAHETVKIGTGLAIALPEGYFGAIFARSGLAAKQGLRPANCVGVADCDYRGEYIVALHNDTDLPKAVQGVSVTASGNYIFDLRASGYGIQGEYFASGEYIYIKVAISADGVILDCLTVSQAETENIGDVCADPDYYGQYVGKDGETYKNVDTIAGASEYTAPAYRGAIRQAFEAFNALKGEN